MEKMVHGWCIFCCCLVALVGSSFAAPSPWDHIPDTVLRTFEEKNQLFAGKAQKQKLFQIKCGSRILPTPDGEIEVELQVYDPDFEVTLDGEKVDLSTLNVNRMYKGQVVGGSGVVTMECDLNGFVKNVKIAQGGLLTGCLMPIDDEFPGVVAFVDPDSMDSSSYEKYEMGSVEAPRSMGFKEGIKSTGEEQNKNLTLEAQRAREEIALSDVAARPSFRRRVTVAVAFDSTLCAKYGDAAATISAIRSIYLGVSTRYFESVLGLELEVTSFDGSCEESIYDNMTPKTSGCYGTGFLSNVGDHWRENRRNVPRDIVAFITNMEFAEGPVLGCAYLAMLCEFNGLSVNSFSFTSNTVLLEALIAHETGHNCGARHAPDGFMFGKLRGYNDVVEIHEQTINEIAGEVRDKQRCLPVDGMCTNAQLQETGCECETGYVFSISSSRFANSCVDYDECTANPDICIHPNLVCSNTVGSYECTCPAGMTCDMPCDDADLCGEGYECVNLSLSTSTCEDIDECVLGTYTCDETTEVCQNTDGAYECQCADGYIRRGGNCVDVNECEEDSDDCGEDAICVNTEGAFYCECPELYVPFGKDCYFDECTVNLCRKDFLCEMKFGERRCTCPSTCYYRERAKKWKSTCNCDPDCGEWREPCKVGSDCCSRRCNKNKGECRR